METNDIYHGEYKEDFPLDMMNQGFYYGEEEHARMVGSIMDGNAASVVVERTTFAMDERTLDVKDLEIEVKELRRRIDRLEKLVQKL